MSRIDKTSSEIGVHRAPLAADWAGAAGTPVAVGLDNTGKVVPGAGNTGIVGIVIRQTSKYPGNKAGDVVDILNHCELVEFGGAEGTLYTANTTTGAITSAAASATQVPVGYTVEADRLVVHVAGRDFYGT